MIVISSRDLIHDLLILYDDLVKASFYEYYFLSLCLVFCTCYYITFEPSWYCFMFYGCVFTLWTCFMVGGVGSCMCWT